MSLKAEDAACRLLAERKDRADRYSDDVWLVAAAYLAAQIRISALEHAIGIALGTTGTSAIHDRLEAVLRRRVTPT